MEINNEMTYSEALARLEEIVRKMQSPDCDIDLLSEYTADALALLQFCRGKLTRTDEEVKRCLAELGDAQG